MITIKPYNFIIKYDFLLYKKCHKLDPAPRFVVNEHMGFLKFIKKKDTPKMECPYCNGTMIPIENFK